MIDCADAARLVEFWSLALDYVPSPPPEGFATWHEWYLSVGVPEEELDLTGDGTDRLTDPNGVGPPIWFQPVPEVKSVKNRLISTSTSAGTIRASSSRIRSAAGECAPRGAS